MAPSQLHAYTSGVSRLRAEGGTIEAVLDDLDRQYPGLKFRLVDEQARIRAHIRLFIGQTAARDVHAPLADGDELLIFGALSGG